MRTAAFGANTSDLTGCNQRLQITLLSISAAAIRAPDLRCRPCKWICTRGFLQPSLFLFCTQVAFLKDRLYKDLKISSVRAHLLDYKEFVSIFVLASIRIDKKCSYEYIDIQKDKEFKEGENGLTEMKQSCFNLKLNRCLKEKNKLHFQVTFDLRNEIKTRGTVVVR